MASPARHAIDRFVLVHFLHFYFCFRFLLIHAAGFSATPHSCFDFIWVLDFGVSVDGKYGILCEDDVEVGVGAVEEELVDKPGTTNGT